MVKKRTYLDIIFEILNAVIKSGDGLRKTHIMYKVNLSYSQLVTHLNFLIDNKFLEKSKKSKVYTITPKGKKFLQDYKKLMNSLANGVE